jgi:hypothetical protein
LKVVREEKQISDEEFVLLSGVRKTFEDWMNYGCIALGEIIVSRAPYSANP